MQRPLTRKAEFYAKLRAYENHHERSAKMVYIHYPIVGTMLYQREAIFGTCPDSLRDAIDAVMAECDDDLRFIASPAKYITEYNFV
jgi:hypothetical protein